MTNHITAGVVDQMELGAEILHDGSARISLANGILAETDVIRLPHETALQWARELVRRLQDHPTIAPSIATPSGMTP